MFFQWAYVIKNSLHKTSEAKDIFVECKERK